MNNNPFVSQPTHAPQRSQQPPLRPPQPDYPALWDVAQHSRQSHVQASPAPAYNPQWTVPPPPEQSVPVLYTNYDYSPQWQRPQLQYQQHQYHALIALPPAAQPACYNSYQSTADYHQHYIPHVVASPQPQLPYDSHLQPQQQQQQKRLYHTTPQHLMPVKRLRLDGPNLNRQVQHHPPPPQLQFMPPPPLINAWLYPNQNQGSGCGDGSGGSNNAHLSANEEGAVGSRGGMSSGGVGARGESMSGNRGGMAGRGRSGSHMGSKGGDGRGGRSGGGVHSHGPRGNFGEAASMQARSRSQFPNIAEPATIPVTTQFEGAQSFTISGHPIMTNIGMNNGVHNVTTVNHYGGTHGLEKLERFVSFAALYNSSTQDPDRRCHPGTRENVLMRLRQWIDNHNATDLIFWLFGPAGAGKSAIAQTIARGYNQGEVAATFFFFRSDAARNDGNRLFPTIAWQLAFSIPATKEFIVHAVDETPHLPMTDVETQFEQLVAHLFEVTNNIASQMRHPAPVVIIDGLDECLDEQLQRRILTVIGNAVKDCRVPLRFLISSRPEALIEDIFHQYQDFTLRIDLANLYDSNRDIKKYLADKFSVIAKKQGLAPTWPGQEIIKEIVIKSSGNFILASTLIRFIGDEDYSAESQLDIVRKLKPHGTMSPFALIDKLYWEILKQQRDQDFLKTFLALLVGRSSVRGYNLHEDDAMLMNVSEQELHIKLRRMSSLLKFKPFIDAYHKSFLDFLQDSSRSGQYHVSKRDGSKRYLELIVKSVVRHVSMAIEESNCHETCRSSPRFKHIVTDYPPKIVLPAEDWQEALKPLLDLQDKLLEISKPRPCRVAQIMRDLQLHLVILQRSSHDIAAAPSLESNNNKTITEWSSNIPERDLDRCLSGLLSCLQRPNSVLAIDTVIIERMSSLLAFDHAETAARIRSVTDAQKLINIVDSLTNDGSFLSQYGRDAARKASCLLASEIFARVPVLPQSLFLNGHTQQCDWFRKSSSGRLEYMCSSAVINRILGHNYTLPTWIISQGAKFTFVDGNVNEQNESVDKWLEKTCPNFVTRIRVMLEVARTIRYLHSMDVVTALDCLVIQPEYFTLDSNLHAQIMFRGFFEWQIREKLIFSPVTSMTDFTSESNISAFADLFRKVCFDGDEEFDGDNEFDGDDESDCDGEFNHDDEFNGDGDDENLSNQLVEDTRQLIERCRVEDPKSWPTMEDIVKEMETWNLI